MNKADLTKILKDINLSKKEFANLSDISYNTVNNWNDETKPIPSWVESWLYNFVKAKSYEEVKNAVLDIEGIK